MSENYKVIDSNTPTFVTMTIVGWVGLFIRSRYVNLLTESIIYCQTNKGLKVHAFVFMTNHIHMIVSSSDVELQDVIRDFKKHTSRQIIAAIKETGESRGEWILNKFSYEAKRNNRAKNYKVWQDGFHPVILDTGAKIKQRVKYTHENPVKAGFVFHERDWVQSSYRKYEENGYFLDINIDKL